MKMKVAWVGINCSFIVHKVEIDEGKKTKKKQLKMVLQYYVWR